MKLMMPNFGRRPAANSWRERVERNWAAREAERRQQRKEMIEYEEKLRVDAENADMFDGVLRAVYAPKIEAALFATSSNIWNPLPQRDVDPPLERFEYQGVPRNQSPQPAPPLAKRRIVLE